MQTEGLGGQQLKINQPDVLLGIPLLYKVETTRPPQLWRPWGRGGKGAQEGCTCSRPLWQRPSFEQGGAALRADEVQLSGPKWPENGTVTLVDSKCCMSISLFSARKTVNIGANDLKQWRIKDSLLHSWFWNGFST